MSKGLEALEDLVETIPFVLLETNSMKYVAIIEKELKALEIIKKHIRVEKDEYGLYWLCGAFGATGISEEEYELLKEVLE